LKEKLDVKLAKKFKVRFLINDSPFSSILFAETDIILNYCISYIWFVKVLVILKSPAEIYTHRINSFGNRIAVYQQKFMQSGAWGNKESS